MIKLCSCDPSPPPFSYVKGGGGIFAHMAVHNLDISRFLAGADPIDIPADKIYRGGPYDTKVQECCHNCGHYKPTSSNLYPDPSE
jgi:predicted dehydrogenase